MKKVQSTWILSLSNFRNSQPISSFSTLQTCLSIFQSESSLKMEILSNFQTHPARWVLSPFPSSKTLTATLQEKVFILSFPFLLMLEREQTTLSVLETIVQWRNLFKSLLPQQSPETLLTNWLKRRRPSHTSQISISSQGSSALIYQKWEDLMLLTSLTHAVWSRPQESSPPISSYRWLWSSLSQSSSCSWSKDFSKQAAFYDVYENIK